MRQEGQEAGPADRGRDGLRPEYRLRIVEGTLSSKRIRVDPYDLHYLESPEMPQHDHPPVVLVHGLGVSARHMVPLAKHVAPRFKVYAPDLPGYGRSPKPWDVYGVADLAGYLDRFCEAAGIESAVFVSLSFGCQIVMELASVAPDRTAGCVLIGPTLDTDARNAPEQVIRLLLDAPFEPPSLFPVIALDYAAFGLRRGAITLWHALADDVAGKLPGVQAPTLIVRGERDTVVPRTWTDRMLSLLPNAGFSEIPGAAHAANFSHPEEVAVLLERFCAEHGLLSTVTEGTAPS